MASHEPLVLIGRTQEPDERRAVAALHAAIGRADPGLVVFFCAPQFDLDRLAAEVQARFPGPVVGCTTAYPLDRGGFHGGGLVGASISARAVTAHTRVIEPLRDFDASAAEALASSLVTSLPRPARDRRFGLLLIDGLSLLEEQTVALLHGQFPDLPLVGGSASDPESRQTQVYCGGRFAAHAATFCVIDAAVPVRTFKTQHLRATGTKLVITEADPPQRRVMEIEGLPAAQAYAEGLGLRPEELGPGVFSRHPLLLSIGGELYARSILKAEPDGSLLFYCAIDRGLVLTLAEGGDLVASYGAQLAALTQELGAIELVLGCDCILRRLECREKGLDEQVAAALAAYPFLGFSTFGEQFNGIHINQTFTGVALGGGQ